MLVYRPRTHMIGSLQEALNEAKTLVATLEDRITWLAHLDDPQIVRGLLEAQPRGKVEITIYTRLDGTLAIEASEVAEHEGTSG